MNTTENIKTVTLTTCNDIAQAHILQGALANEGIQSVLHNENFTSLMPGFNNIMGAGVQILVLENDYQHAREIIGLDKMPVRKLCPFCGSEDIAFSIGKNKGKKVGAILLSLLSATPFGNLKSIYKCRRCGETFENPVEQFNPEKK